MKTRSEWTKESWDTRRAKYGPSGFSPEALKNPTQTTEGALRGWVVRRERYGPTGIKNPNSPPEPPKLKKLREPPKPRRQKLIPQIKMIKYTCSKCGGSKLVGCLRHEPELMYYHCPKCGNNIRDRKTVAEIYALKGS